MPYGLVIDSLGKPSSNVPFMMPKRIADTDPFKAIDSQIGSGPFIYVNAESKPGERHVYIKNTKYKPRAEPASGLAGGKVAKVDRVEFVEMPDPTQQVNALIAGEIDMIENVPHDLIPLLKKDRNEQTVNWNPLGQQFMSVAASASMALPAAQARRLILSIVSSLWIVPVDRHSGLAGRSLKSFSRSLSST